MRGDGHPGKAGCCRSDAANRSQKIVSWTGRPGVAIGARGLGLFGEGGKPYLQHIKPGIQLVYVSIAKPDFHHGLSKIEPEIKSYLIQRSIGQYILHYLALPLGGNYIGQDGQDGSMLTELLFLRCIGHFHALHVKAMRKNP